jgi:hypothetical protein
MVRFRVDGTGVGMIAWDGAQVRVVAIAAAAGQGDLWISVVNSVVLSLGDAE